ncbi:MAG: hypothetical protein RL698_3694 [Pseudomonadota bacterium]|jgi:glycosyltransferase 2 family protein
MNRRVQIAISLAVTIAALWYSLHGLDLGESLAALRGLRLGWLAVVVALAALSLWMRAQRWRFILGTLGPLGSTPVFEATCIGFMGNMVLPLRAGEIIRPLVAARAGAVRMPSALATVAIERLLDLAMLALLASLTLYLVPGGLELRNVARAMLFLVAVALLGLLAAIRWAEPIEAFVERSARRLPESIGHAVVDGARGFLAGVRGLARPAALATAMGWSALVWLGTVAGFAAAALAMNLQAPLVPLGFAVTVIVAAAVSVPSAPGFIGVFWAGSQMALALFGIDRSTALSYGLLNWVVQMVVILSMGTWSLSRLNLSLGEVASAARSAEPAA